MKYEKRRHNASISAVIKRFLDKKGGKVKAARSELDWRFNALAWRYQKQILFAFLDSGKSDRKWAYRKLFTCWDDCFIPVLQELWEKYDEEMLTWLIIRYFPIDFLKLHYDRLNRGRNYYDICARMHDVEGFEVDKTRLTEYDLLRIKRVMGETVTLRDAEDMFFMLIYKFCKGKYQFRARKTVQYYVGAETLYILDRPIINIMLSEIDYLDTNHIGFSEHLRGWITAVTNKFLSKNEMLADRRWDNKEEEARMREMQKSFCYEQIDPKYTRVWDTFDCDNQQQFLDYLEKRHEERKRQEEMENENSAALEHLLKNPSVKDLYRVLDLEYARQEELEKNSEVLDCLRDNPSMRELLKEFGSRRCRYSPF